jgi:proteic killer suppression protein
MSWTGLSRPSILHFLNNWRLTFGWDGEDAIEVDLEDYHG